MALHFIRSFSFVYLSSVRANEAYSELSLKLRIKYGIVVDQIPNFHDNWIKGVQKNIPVIIENTERKIFDYISRFDLEIGEAADNTDFLLGDNPVLNMSNDGRIGIIQGVAFDQSNSVVMSLGPKHIGALITKNPIKEYRKLSSMQVENYNNRVIANSYREFYKIMA